MFHSHFSPPFSIYSYYSFSFLYLRIFPIFFPSISLSFLNHDFTSKDILMKIKIKNKPLNIQRFEDQCEVFISSYFSVNSYSYSKENFLCLRARYMLGLFAYYQSPFILSIYLTSSLSTTTPSPKCSFSLSPSFCLCLSL